MMLRRLLLCVAVLFVVRPESLFADKLQGVVLDEHDKPIAGARIDIATAAPKVGRSAFCPSCYLDCRKWARSNEDGKFEIDGLDPSLKFRILSTASGKQTKLTPHVDPSVEIVHLNLEDFPDDTPAERILLGTVVDKNGVPIPGALIEPYGAEMKGRRWWGQINAQPTVSDDDGKFRMLLNDDFLGLEVTVTADSYAGTTTALLKPGNDAHEIQVPKGTSVKGQLTLDGKPQAGRRVAVVQTQRSIPNHFIKSVLAITDSEGRFTFSALPAGQKYAIFSPRDSSGREDSSIKDFLATKTFLVKGDEEIRDLGALELQPAHSIDGRVTMSDGSEIPKNLKLTLNRDPAWDLIEVPIQEDGSFQYSGLPPETYEISFFSREVQIDAGRSNFHMTRPSQFGIRLTKSHHGISIPLVRIDSTVATDGAKSKENTQEAQTKKEAANEADQESPGIEPTKPRLPGEGSQKVVLTQEPVPPNGPKLSVRGTVTTSGGKRIGGATVLLRTAVDTDSRLPGSDLSHDVLAQTTTDSNGRFSFGGIGIPLRMYQTISGLTLGQKGAEVWAYADGYGLASTPVLSLADKSLIRISLEPEADIRGVIHDEAGKGIDHARIRVFGITSEDPTVNTVFKGDGDIRMIGSKFAGNTFSDPNGNFVIKHVPQNRQAVVWVDSSQHQMQPIAISTSSAPANSSRSKQEPVNHEKTPLPIQQSPLDITLKRTSAITVRVVDHNEKPVESGTVTVDAPNKRMSQAEYDNPSGVTLGGITAGECQVSYFANALVPNFSISNKFDVTDGDKVNECKLVLPKPIWVTGKVIDLETGEPVVGAFFTVYRPDRPEGESRILSRCVSSENGTFRVPVLPGKNRMTSMRGLYGYRQSGNGAFRGVKDLDFDVAENGQPEEIVYKLSPGLIITGTVLDSDQKPVNGVLVHAQQKQPYLSVGARTDEQGRFRLAGLFPNNSTDIAVSTQFASEFKTIEAAKEDVEIRQEDLQITLHEGIRLTGRVIKNGKPVAGLKIELDRNVVGQKVSSAVFPSATTDQDGRYEIGGLNPGDMYNLRLLTKDGSVAAGWMYQNPYRQKVAQDQTGVVEIPDAVLIGSNQSLSGFVVDREDRRVVGLTVSAQLKNGRSIARKDKGSPPWGDTDQNGEFKLQKLPEEPIELMIYKRGPGGTTIRYPVRIVTQMNQTGIRIVYDLSLLDGVEDLDK